MLVMIDGANRVVLRGIVSAEERRERAIWYNPLLGRCIAQEAGDVPLEYILTAIELDETHNVSAIVRTAKVLYAISKTKPFRF